MSDDLGVALQLIASQLGIKPEQLVASTNGIKPMPTLSEYIGRLTTALPHTTVRNYRGYWRKLEKVWGTYPLDAPSTTELNQLVQQHRSHAAVRSNSRGGRGAAANMVSAIRCVYRHAENDGLISSAANPAKKVSKPRRQPGRRHALTRSQVVEVGTVASTTGNDTELDAIIVRLHIESACRRSAAIHIEITDLDPDDSLIRLHEKGEKVWWQPISPLLMNKLLEHVAARGGAETTSQVLRYRDGRPITTRRYDYITNRVRRHLPWADRLQISIHWVRHTTLTYVEREFGTAVARAYAGHAEVGGGSATPIYTTASIVEVAEALVALTGHPHPLARIARHPLAPRSP